MTGKELIKHFAKEVKATPDGWNKSIFSRVIKDPAITTRKRRPDGDIDVSLVEDFARR